MVGEAAHRQHKTRIGWAPRHYQQIMPIHRPGRLLAASLACALAVPAAGQLGRKKDQSPAYAQPAENLLIIVADIQRHIDDDVYRFPVATDVTGQNVFRAGAARLANYETLYPSKNKDAVTLAKAQVYEKLGDYSVAQANNEQAAKSSDAAIAKVASDGAGRAKRFGIVMNQPIDQSLPRFFERDMKLRIDTLDKLADEFRNTPYRCLALVERERSEMQLARFYVAMRFMQPYSTDDAVRQIKRNIERNSDSKNRFTHHLMLADLHYALAQEYVLKADPDGPFFSAKAFEGFSDIARTEYHIVEQADGFPEKLEGRAKLMALEALAERIAERSR
jgi:hypothetical protein